MREATLQRVFPLSHDAIIEHDLSYTDLYPVLLQYVDTFQLGTSDIVGMADVDFAKAIVRAVAGFADMPDHWSVPHKRMALNVEYIVNQALTRQVLEAVHILDTITG